MFSEKGFERERDDFGKMLARVGWGDSGVGAFAVLSAGVNTPHSLNVIKGKKIAFEAGDLAALLHPCQRTPTTNGKRATLASGGRLSGKVAGDPIHRAALSPIPTPCPFPPLPPCYVADPLTLAHPHPPHVQSATTNDRRPPHPFQIVNKL